jgi:hypothetical protein
MLRLYLLVCAADTTCLDIVDEDKHSSSAVNRLADRLLHALGLHMNVCVWLNNQTDKTVDDSSQDVVGLYGACYADKRLLEFQVAAAQGCKGAR